MEYLALAIFIYVAFALANNQIIKTTIGNEIVVPNKKNTQKISLIAVFVLIFIAGFRAFSVGADIGSYRYHFDLIGVTHNPAERTANFEPLYKLIEFVFTLFGATDLSFSLFLFALSIFNVLIAVYVAKKLSPNISIAMFLFVCLDVYLPSFSMLRQSLAISFGMLAFVFMKGKKPIRFIAAVLLAYYCHESAIVLLPFYLLNFLKNRKLEYIFYIVSLIGLVIFRIFDEWIILYVCQYLGLFYFGSYGMQKSYLSGFSTFKYVAFIVLFLFFIGYRIYMDKKGKKLSRVYDLSLNMFFVVVLISIYNFLILGISSVSRLTYHFMWPLMLLIPEFLESIKNKKHKKIMTIIILIVGLCYLSTVVLIRDQFSVVPYKFIINF